MNEKRIIKMVEAFAARSGLATSTVCERAVGNSRLYSRLMNGGTCSLRVADRLSEYIAANSEEVAR